MHRRKFIKNGLIISAGTALSPSLIKEINATERVSLKFNPSPENWSDRDISLSWIGHATVLINFQGKWILTDPVFFERVGVYLLGTSIGPSRITPPALNIDQIPKPDIILLSHAHMDHTDYPTLDWITNKYPNQIDMITAYLTADVTQDLPWKSISVMDWGDELDLQGIKFKALEVQHFGWRFPWEKDRSRGYMKDGRSYNAYLMEYKGKKVMFGGDTAFSEKFRVIENENPDISIMPVGAYNPWRRAHCNPEEALIMAAEINSKNFIPIHCQTFKQGQEPFEEPIDWLKRSVGNYNLNLGLTAIGQTFVL